MKAVKLTFWASLGMLVVGTGAQAEIVLPGSNENAKTNTEASSVPAPVGTNKKPDDILEFLNGDVLHGEFLSMDAKTGARWQHPAIKNPMDIALSSVARIKLNRPKTNTKTNSTQSCSVRLTNRDELYGTLVSMDATNLHLNTWYGGELNIPRKLIESIVPGQTGVGTIYEGPTGMEGWTAKGAAMVVRPGGVIDRLGQSWAFQEGVFVASGSGTLGRAFEFPPMVNIEFDIAWTGYLQMALSLFSDNLESYGGNAYILQLSQGTIYLQRMSRAGDSSMLGNEQVPALARKNQLHISIRANREQKTIALVIDGNLVKQWQDPGNFMSGPNLVFHQQGQGRTRLSHLKISQWDGKFDTPDTAGPKSKEDLVKLSNRDKISGVLKSIENGKMTFQTAFAALEVPLERVTQVELAGEKAEQPPQKPGEVRLSFQDRGTVSINIERWDAQQITGSSPTLGQVKLNPSAFAEIKLNPGEKRAEPEEAGMGAPGQDDAIIEKE